MLIMTLSPPLAVRNLGRVLCCKLRNGRHYCFLTYNHPDIRVQCVAFKFCRLKSLLTLSLADATAQLLTVPPYAAAAGMLCLMAYASDRLQNRGMFTAASCFIAGVGYVFVFGRFLLHSTCAHMHVYYKRRLLLTVTSNNVRYFATFCITIGVYGTIGLVLAWCKCSHIAISVTAKVMHIYSLAQPRL